MGLRRLASWPALAGVAVAAEPGGQQAVDQRCAERASDRQRQ
jgi:hypothetical protein